MNSKTNKKATLVTLKAMNAFMTKYTFLIAVGFIILMCKPLISKKNDYRVLDLCIMTETFMAIDPLHINSNPFEFVNNDPTNTIDQNGKCPICGVGQFCVRNFEGGANSEEYMQVLEQFFIDEVGRIATFRDFINLAGSSAKDHFYHDRFSSWTERDFAADQKSLNLELMQIKQDYLNSVPGSIKEIMRKSSIIRDLAALQPQKFKYFAANENVNPNLYRPINRILSRNEVPSLQEMTYDAIAQTPEFGEYAGRVQQAIVNYTVKLNNRFFPGAGPNGQLPIFHEPHEAHYIHPLPEEYKMATSTNSELRALINPENPTWIGAFNPGSRQFFKQYRSIRNMPFYFSVNQRAAAYFPERTMGGNTVEDTWLFPNL